uniref:Family with sequence similarity 110 member C n=1 Tax=Pygocentrus nattereri TaxID=42514 RepID=A0A3B4EM45_PYGNA
MLDTSRILQKGPEYLRKQMEREREATGRSAAERLAATKPEYIRNQRLLTSETVTNQGSPERSQQAPNSLPNITGEDPPQEVNVVKRNSSKKRPDSLLLYRHKGELQRGSQGGNGKKLTKQPKPTATVEVKDAVWKPRTVDTSDQEDCKPATVVRSERSSRRSRVSRSHSDISSRYSRNFANFDAFFMYCGLDDDIIELMGRDNFCSGSEGMEEEFISSGIVRSVSVVASDDGFSQASSNRSDGLQEDELPDKKTGQGPSVIERNARVIKWLYSCRNATQSGKMLRDLD